MILRPLKYRKEWKYHVDFRYLFEFLHKWKMVPRTRCVLQISILIIISLHNDTQHSTEDKFILHCNKILSLNCVSILFTVKMYMFINILAGFRLVFPKCTIFRNLFKWFLLWYKDIYEIKIYFLDNYYF